MTRLQQRLSNWHFFAGLFLALGTTLFAPAIDYGLFVLQTFRPFRLNRVCLMLALIIGLSVFYSTDWVAPITWGFRVVLLGSLIRHIKINRSFVFGGLVVLIVQLGFVGWQLHNGIIRPYGISSNASSLGMTGFGLFELSPMLGLFAAVTLGLAGSRTYLLSVGILTAFAVWRKDTLTVATGLLAALIMLAVTIETNPERLSFAGIMGAVDTRATINTPLESPRKGVISDVSVGNIQRGLWEHLQVNPLGFGYRDFNHSTDRINPHNQFILMLWELGWLAIPFAGLVLYMVWRSDVPWRYRLAMIPPLLLTDEFFARPEGVYAVFLLTIGWMGYKLNTSDHKSVRLDRWRSETEQLRSRMPRRQSSRSI